MESVGFFMGCGAAVPALFFKGLVLEGVRVRIIAGSFLARRDIGVRVLGAGLGVGDEVGLTAGLGEPAAGLSVGVTVLGVGLK